ncbi:GntR family transcriptional regulator [Streptomyces sp. NBC_01378]|uniref:GntR family transcriptional regulator n=1 Tax=Streptomyces sp. NBC_01378 TaxID=2903844 RepID=UPI00324CD878
MPSLDVKPLDRDAVFEQLRVEILDGTLPAGHPLREVALAERFGLSRTPIRDALSRLEQTGLAVRGKRGLLVKRVDPETVVQVYSLRILLEEDAAGQAAEARTINDLLRLEALTQRDRALGSSISDQQMIRSNMEFHETVWRSTHNDVLVDLLERLTGHLIHDPGTTLAVGDRWSESLDEHEELADAIAQRDGQRARKAARKHFSRALELRIGLLRQAILEDGSEADKA